MGFTTNIESLIFWKHGKNITNHVTKGKKAKINLNEWEGNITFALIFLLKIKVMFES